MIANHTGSKLRSNIYICLILMLPLIIEWNIFWIVNQSTLPIMPVEHKEGITQVF